MKISCLFILLCGLLATSSAQMAQSGSSQFNSALGLELYRKLSTDSQSLDLQEPVMHAINSALDALDLLGNWDHKATVQIRNTQIHKMTINKLNSREMKVQIPVSSDLVVKFLGFPYQFQIQGNISILADVDKNTLNIKSCGFLTGSTKIRSDTSLSSKTFLLGKLEQALKKVVSTGLGAKVCPLFSSWLSRPLISPKLTVYDVDLVSAQRKMVSSQFYLKPPRFPYLPEPKSWNPRLTISRGCARGNLKTNKIAEVEAQGSLEAS